jgi:hypothetical protein
MDYAMTIIKTILDQRRKDKLMGFPCDYLWLTDEERVELAAWFKKLQDAMRELGVPEDDLPKYEDGRIFGMDYRP